MNRNNFEVDFRSLLATTISQQSLFQLNIEYKNKNRSSIFVFVPDKFAQLCSDTARWKTSGN